MPGLHCRVHSCEYTATTVLYTRHGAFDVCDVHDDRRVWQMYDDGQVPMSANCDGVLICMPCMASEVWPAGPVYPLCCRHPALDPRTPGRLKANRSYVNPRYDFTEALRRAVGGARRTR